MNANKRAKAHAHIKKSAWMNNVPEFNIMDYKISMIRMLNFFNTEVPGKEKQAWVINYWADQNKIVKGMDKLSDAYFNQLAVLVKLKDDGYEIEPQHQKFLDDRYHYLFAKTKQPVFDDDGNEILDKDEIAKRLAETKKANTIQDRIEKNVKTHIAEFDGALDELCTVGTDFNAKAYLLKHQVKAPQAKRIGDDLKVQVKEWEEALKGKDPQLVEGYSNFDKRGLKSVITFLTDAMNECNTMAVVARTTRAPRKQKEKPAGVIAAKVKYMKDCPQYKLQSLSPAKMVGASMVVLFDTKYRKMLQYESMDGTTISIKGTTLQNFDPKKSYSKTIRKTEILAGIQSLTKRPFNALIKGVKSVESKVTGRLNENQVILLVY